MNKSIYVAAGLAIAFGSMAVSANATAPKPKTTEAQAQASAVHRIPGKIVSSKYEFEDGHWQYAVLVQNKKGLYEVEVSASTGKVTDTEKTSLAEEANEAKEDAKAAAAHHAR